MQPTQAAADRGGARRIDVVAPRSQFRLSDGLADLGRDRDIPKELAARTRLLAAVMEINPFCDGHHIQHGSLMAVWLNPLSLAGNPPVTWRVRAMPLTPNRHTSHFSDCQINQRGVPPVNQFHC
jgi:hypothetical protein